MLASMLGTSSSGPGSGAEGGSNEDLAERSSYPPPAAARTQGGRPRELRPGPGGANMGPQSVGRGEISGSDCTGAQYGVPSLAGLLPSQRIRPLSISGPSCGGSVMTALIFALGLLAVALFAFRLGYSVGFSKATHIISPRLDRMHAENSEDERTQRALFLTVRGGRP